MHDDNVLRGKLDAFVDVGNGRVIPLGDFAKENSGEGLGSEVQLCGDSGDVVGRNNRAQHGGKVKNSGAVLVLVSLELLVVHGAVGGAEIHGAFCDLFDAAAGTDGLIVDLKIGVLLVVFVKPFGIHGVRKRCARAVDGERAV